MTTVSVVAVGSILLALSAYSVMGRAISWPAGSFDRLLLVRDLGDLLVGLGALMIALVLATRLRSREDARALTLFLACLAVAVAPTATDVLAWLPSRAIYAAALGFTLAGFLHFTFVFPEPFTPPSTGRHSGRVSLRLRGLSSTLARYHGVVWAWGAMLALLWYGVLAGLSQETEFRTWGMYPASHGLLAALMLANLLSVVPLVLGLRNLWTSYVRGTSETRRKVLWIGEAATVGVMGFACVEFVVLLNAVAPRTVLAGTFPWIITLGKPLTLLLVVASFAFAIFFGGVLHPSLVLGSTVLYGALGMIAVGVFSGVENALSEVLEAQLQLPGILGALIAGAATAIVLVPARKLFTILLRRPSLRVDTHDRSDPPAAAT